MLVQPIFFPVTKEIRDDCGLIARAVAALPSGDFPLDDDLLITQNKLVKAADGLGKI